MTSGTTHHNGAIWTGARRHDWSSCDREAAAAAPRLEEALELAGPPSVNYLYAVDDAFLNAGASLAFQYHHDRRGQPTGSGASP